MEVSLKSNLNNRVHGLDFGIHSLQYILLIISSTLFLLQCPSIILTPLFMEPIGMVNTAIYHNHVMLKSLSRPSWWKTLPSVHQ